MRFSVPAVVLLSLFPFSSIWAAGRSALVANALSQAIQNTRADDDNLSRMRDVSMLQKFVRRGYLVATPSSTRTYYMHAISPQYRYCRPWTRTFLDRLSRQYYAKFGERLRVTSLVRTTGSQLRLAEYNDNAAEAFGPLRSSHLTGASIDISKHDMSPAGQRWMRNMLYSLREQGYVYAIEEFEQPAFHVMVFKNYPKSLKRRSPRSLHTAQKKAVTPVEDAGVAIALEGK